MADLSFIEDAVAFPEKEEDEEEEEEGVEWGYEEGNPPAAAAGRRGPGPWTGRRGLSAACVPPSARRRTPQLSRAPSTPGSPLSHVGPLSLPRSPAGFGTQGGGRACHLCPRWEAWPYCPAGVGTASSRRASITAAAGTFLVF